MHAKIIDFLSLQKMNNYTYLIMKKAATFLCCLCILLAGCKNRPQQELNESDNSYSVEDDNTDSLKIYFLDFEKNLKDTETDTFTINSIAKNITFIPLETSPKFLLRYHFFKTAKVGKSYYVSSGIGSMFSGIIEFDSTGHFKNYLVQNGRGPKELTNVSSWSYNSSMQQLIARGSGAILLHSFQKNVTDKYNLSEWIGHGCLLNDGNIVALATTVGTGDTDAPYLKFLNHKGEIVKLLYYPSKRNIYYNLQETQGDVGILESYQLYPSNSGGALFKDMFNDTIYHVSGIDDVRPYIILNRGSLTPKAKDGLNREAKAKTVIVTKIVEAEDHFFILYGYKDVMYNAIWNKQSLTLIANTVADFSNENYPVINNNGFTKYRTPNNKEILIAISSYYDGKLYGVLDASQAMEFLPDIKEDDNPVLMIIDI